MTLIAQSCGGSTRHCRLGRTDPSTPPRRAARRAAPHFSRFTQQRLSCLISCRPLSAETTSAAPRASLTRPTSASASTSSRRRRPPSFTATGRRETARPTSASTASPRRSSPPSRRACSRRGWGGTARTARCGAGAGRGGERTRPPRRQGPFTLIRSRSPCIPSGMGSCVGRVTRPLGNSPSAWACGPSRRRGTDPALPSGHAPGLVSAGELSAPPTRADRAVPGDRDAPPDVPRAHGRGGRDGLAGVRATRVRGVPQVWPARARSGARAM